jgi:pyrroloquinoline quinone (PQQ) biosynthesis protein C
MPVNPFREKLRKFQFQHPLFRRVHPFWLDCFRGKLSVSGLCVWGLDVYPLIRDFPRLYTNVAAKCESAEAMTSIAETIYEETGCGAIAESHQMLFRIFLVSIGVQEDEITDKNQTDSGRAALDFIWRITRDDSFVAGLAMVGVGVERPLPALFEQLVRAFRQHYAMDDKGVKFFAIHDVADVKHSQVATRIVSEFAQTTAEQSHICEVLTHFWDLQKKQMDELYHRTQLNRVSNGNLATM